MDAQYTTWLRWTPNNCKAVDTNQLQQMKAINAANTALVWVDERWATNILPSKQHTSKPPPPKQKKTKENRRKPRKTYENLRKTIGFRKKT